MLKIFILRTLLLLFLLPMIYATAIDMILLRRTNVENTYSQYLEYELEYLIIYSHGVDTVLHIIAIDKDLKIHENISVNDLRDENIKWYWVDFDCPTDEESNLLESFFNFHPLAIEDCLHHLQRPKIDHYEDYNFLVVHALKQKDLSPQELDLFVGKKFIVTYHKNSLPEIDAAFRETLSSPQHWKEGTIYVQYEILDKLVDNYFPASYVIEDDLREFDDIDRGITNKAIINNIFEIRSRIIKLKRIVNQMRDLLYKIIDSESVQEHRSRHAYFSDVYDHLLRLSEFVESSLLTTSDLRDSYVSMNSDRMNRTMMLFTSITTIFVPLTFIVGIYGMNFEFMPELSWRYGYFFILAIMGSLAVIMLLWFKRKGWFDM
jgi:magnesium transporter